MGGRIGYGALSSLALLASAFSALSSVTARAGDLDISTALTNPVSTAVGDGTGPGAITVEPAGSIVVSGPTAVTINSSNNFLNDGAIATSITANGNAILVDTGQTTPNNISATITNDGVITAAGLDPADPNAASSINNSVITVSGVGTLTGSVVNEADGSIESGANGGYGIAIRSNMVGNLTNTGQINVLGSNAFGIETTGLITGTVTTGGVIAAGGTNGVGVYIGGGINGELMHTGLIEVGSGPQVALAANGIDLTTTSPIPGLAGLWIASNVTGGVLLQGNTYTSAQEALNPTLVTNETVADSTLSIIGSGPALYVAPGGPAGYTSFTIGPVTANSNYSIVSQGNITSSGSISGYTATGIEIDGAVNNGKIYTANLSNGFWNQGGTITVTSIDARSTVFHIGNYGIVSTIQNDGDMIGTTTDSTANSITGFIGSMGGDAYGILVEPLGTLNSFVNTGNLTITAGGPTGSAYGLVDKSGTLTSFTNTGTITAGIPQGGTGKTVAVDLSANSQGLTFTDTGAIFGDVYLGGGNETVTVSNATISGSVVLQAGASQSGNNVVTLNTATITDELYLGSGTEVLNLNNSTVGGGVANGTGQTALNVNNSSMSIIGNRPLTVSNATFSSGSSLIFDVSQIAPPGPVLNASGTVSFATGSTVTAAFTGILTTPQTYTLISAGSLTSGSGVPLTQFATAPSSFLNSTSFSTAPGNPNTLLLTVQPKTAAQLQLGPNETAVYGLFAGPVNQDSGVATAIEAQGTQAAFEHAFRQLLPDTSGATLQVALNTQDAAAGEIRRRLVGVAKNGIPDHSQGDTASFWAQAIGDYSVQSPHGEEQGFDAWGLGIALGTDTPVNLGDRTNIGISFVETWHSANLEVSPLSPTQFYTTLGYLYGRTDIGPAYLEFMAGGGISNYNQARHFEIDTTTRIATSIWNGYQYGGTVEAGATKRWDDYSITPFLRASYLKMHEDGFTEQGGGPALDLVVGPKDPSPSWRGSAGFNFDRDFPVYFDSYIEGEFRANYTREITQSPFALSAAFVSGSPTFVNVANPRAPNRYTFGLGIAGKDSYSSISLDYDTELASGYISYRAGVTARFRF